MRGLFRSAVALFAVGLAVIGCGRSDSPKDPNQEPIDAPYQAAFRVPGLS
jgi:hypothetical protein